MSNMFVDDEHLISDPQVRADDSTGELAAKEDSYLLRAAQAFRDSTDYWESNYYRQWQTNLALFRSVHPPGSKYHSEAYGRRSRLFRPKTRAAVLRAEAAAAMTFFATDTSVLVEPEDEENPLNLLGAQIRQELLNYRTSSPDRRYGLPWLQTLIGAVQDCYVMGACCSYQDWLYKESESVSSEPELDEDGAAVLDGETGEPWRNEVRKTTVEADRPEVRLVPLENLRFSPAADWLDPINSSPYVIEMMPFYVCDVREKMDAGEWTRYSNVEIARSREDRSDAVRQEREGRERRPAEDDHSSLTEYSVVWVHRNIMRIKGKDVVFHTLGTHLRLDEPRLVREVYPHGRPYVWGTMVLETHRTMSSAPVELGAGMQAAANEIQNSRFDNVRLVLNKRYFVGRHMGVDVASLRTSQPGGTVLMDDLNGVRADETNDVTGSAYQEQDRVSLDFDEIMGTFSSGSVQSNRKLNETVGGLNLLSQDSNGLTEYRLRLFSATWVSRVLAQLDALEMHYESDARVLELCGRKSKVWKMVREQYLARYGQPPQITPELLQMGGVEVRIDVGYGATNPQGRIEKMMLGLNVIATAAPSALQRLKQDALIDQVFGILGWQSGSRFFQEQDEEADPRVTELEQMVQQLQAQIETESHKMQAKAQADLALAQAKANSDADLQRAAQDHEYRMAQLKQADEAMRRDLDGKKATADTAINRAKLALDRDRFIAERGDRQFEQDNVRADTSRADEHAARQEALASSVTNLESRGSEAAGAVQTLLERLEAMDEALVSLSGAGSDQAAKLAERLDSIADELESVAETAQEQAAADAERDGDRSAIRAWLESNGSPEIQALLKRTDIGRPEAT